MYPVVRPMNLSSLVFHMISDFPVSQPYKRERMTERIFIHGPNSIKILKNPKFEILIYFIRISNTLFEL